MNIFTHFCSKTQRWCFNFSCVFEYLHPVSDVNNALFQYPGFKQTLILDFLKNCVQVGPWPIGDPVGGFLSSWSCRRIFPLTQTRHPQKVPMIGWLDDYFENEFSALDTWHLSWLPSSTLRVWLILGILYYYRALTMFITVLPKPDETYICAPKVSHLYKDVHCNDADKCFIAPLPPFRCLFSLMKKGTWSVHRQICNWQKGTSLPFFSHFFFPVTNMKHSLMSRKCSMMLHGPIPLFPLKSVSSPQTASISTMDVIKRVVQLLSGGQSW